MSPPDSHDPIERYLPAVTANLPWLLPALVGAGLVYVGYLFTYGTPTGSGGLFLEMAEQISATGYRLPERIPHYTGGGIPFGYPPLGLYLVALVLDLTALDGWVLARFLPGLLVVAAVVPFYAFAADLLESRPRAAFATLVFAVNPAIFYRHIQAGGMVRTVGFAVMLCGLYTGRRLFRTGGAKWVFLSGLLFGLSLLSHLIVSVFFAVSYLVFYAHYDRSLRGLLGGVAVVAIGLAVAAPWWVQVVATHGPGLYLDVTGASDYTQFPNTLFTFIDPQTRLLPVWHVLAVLGALYLVALRRLLLPVWFGATLLLVGLPRFVHLVGALMVAIFVFEALAPAVENDRWSLPKGTVPALFVACLAAYAVVGGVGYTTNYAGVKDQSLPRFVGESDREAARWVTANTAPESRFVVVGNGREWFPHLTDRTSLVNSLGSEWHGGAVYRQQLRLKRTLDACPTGRCLIANLRKAGAYPEYVYVQLPSESHSAATEDRHRVVSDLRAAEAYELAYRNDGVVVFRRTDATSDRSAEAAATPRSHARSRSPRHAMASRLAFRNPYFRHAGTVGCAPE